MNRLIILQGVPGSRKSTVARRLQCQEDRAVVVSTDDRLYNEKGEYEFIGDLHAERHKRTQEKAAVLLRLGCTVIVDNTNILNLHIKPYVQAAVALGIPVDFIRVLGEYNNIHGVPPHVINRMRGMMENLSIEKALGS